jgi:hypothetical protein
MEDLEEYKQSDHPDYIADSFGIFATLALKN